MSRGAWSLPLVLLAALLMVQPAQAAAGGAGPVWLLPGEYRIELYVLDRRRRHKAEVSFSVGDDLTVKTFASRYEGRGCAGRLLEFQAGESALVLAETVVEGAAVCAAAQYVLTLPPDQRYAAEPTARISAIEARVDGAVMPTHIVSVSHARTGAANFIRHHRLWQLADVLAVGNPAILHEYASVVGDDGIRAEARKAYEAEADRYFAEMRSEATAAAMQRFRQRFPASVRYPEALHEEAELAYRAALAANTVQAMQVFRRNYAGSHRAEDAYAQEAALAYQAVRGSDNMVDLQDFAEKYPGTSPADEARSIAWNRFAERFSIELVGKRESAQRAFSGGGIARSAAGSCMDLGRTVSVAPRAGSGAQPVEVTLRWVLSQQYEPLKISDDDSIYVDKVYRLNPGNGYRVSEEIDFGCVITAVRVHHAALSLLGRFVGAAPEESGVNVTLTGFTFGYELQSIRWSAQ